MTAPQAVFLLQGYVSGKLSRCQITGLNGMLQKLCPFPWSGGLSGVQHSARGSHNQGGKWKQVYTAEFCLPCKFHSCRKLNRWKCWNGRSMVQPHPCLGVVLDQNPEERASDHPLLWKLRENVSALKWAEWTCNSKVQCRLCSDWLPLVSWRFSVPPFSLSGSLCSSHRN